MVPRNQRSRAMNAAMMNESSGMGGWQDRSVGERPTMGQYPNPFVYGQTQLFAAQYAWVLYSSDWMAKKIIDIPVFDMFREGWDWKYKGDDNGVDKALEDECRRVQFIPTLIQAKKMEGLVGGCVAVRVTRGLDGETAGDPITPDQIDKGDILCYNIIPSMYIQKVEWEMDPSKPGYGCPKHYHIRGQKFHRSRLVVLDGQPVSPYPQHDFVVATTNWNGFGLSRFSPIWDVIMRANSYQQGASHLVQMASVWFALYKGLRDLKTNRQGQEALDEMRSIMETMSQFNAVILDGDDVDVKNIGASFGSVPELLMSGLQIVCAAADIPATRFLGQAPGGLSVEDRSGLENYYNDIAARQKMELDAVLDREKPFLLNSALGTGKANPEDISQAWIPLWNLSDTEKAQVETLHTNNIMNMASTLGFPDEWIVDELVRKEVITVKPDLEAMERERMLEEMRAFSQQQPVGGDIASETDNPRMPSMNAGDFDESKHKRDEGGKFSTTESDAGGSEDKRPFKQAGSVASPEDKQKKIDSIKIDFSKDNVLPRLNVEDLEKLGKEDKPVLLKKNIIDRNAKRHPDVKPEEYNAMIGKALYASDAIIPSNKPDKPNYYNFVKYLEHDNSVVLLELDSGKDNHEIVHVIKMNNKGVSRL